MILRGTSYTTHTSLDPIIIFENNVGPVVMETHKNIANGQDDSYRTTGIQGERWVHIYGIMYSSWYLPSTTDNCQCTRSLTSFETEQNTHLQVHIPRQSGPQGNPKLSWNSWQLHTSWYSTFPKRKYASDSKSKRVLLGHLVARVFPAAARRGLPCAATPSERPGRV